MLCFAVVVVSLSTFYFHHGLITPVIQFKKLYPHMLIAMYSHEAQALTAHNTMIDDACSSLPNEVVHLVLEHLSAIVL